MRKKKLFSIIFTKTVELLLQSASGLRRPSTHSDPNGGGHARQHAHVGAAERRKDRRDRIAKFKQ